MAVREWRIGCTGRAHVRLPDSVSCWHRERAKMRPHHVRRRRRGLVARATTTTSTATHKGAAAAPSLPENVFQCTFDVRSFDVGPDKGASLPCIINMLQETGVEQLVALHGRGGRFYATDPEMDRLHLIMVLSRLRVDMERYPNWGDRVLVRTWFALSGKMGWRRDWVIVDANTGERLGGASSLWLTVNTETRRLARVSGDLRAKYEQLTNDTEWALGEGITADRVAAPEPAMAAAPSSPCGARAAEAAGAREMCVDVPFGTLDMNGHVNNVEYMRWALDGVPVDIRRKFTCVSMTLEYKSEAEVGSRIASSVTEGAAGGDSGLQPGELRLMHSIHALSSPSTTSSSSGDEIIRGVSKWLPRSSFSSTP